MRRVLIGFGIAVAIWVLVVLVLVALGRRTLARELATLVPNLLVLFRGLLRDPRVPGAPKLWPGVAIVRIAWPIDLIPEFVRWVSRWTMRSSRRSSCATCSGERRGSPSTGGGALATLERLAGAAAAL